jgi:4-hydroxy-tetrahydrodipicolinate reductase
MDARIKSEHDGTFLSDGRSMNIGLLGCAGRMGQMIVRELSATAGLTLAGGIEAPGHPALGQDVAAFAGLAACGKMIGSDADALIKDSDAVITFSTPEATLAHVALAEAHGCPMVIGTTGLDASGAARIDAAARTIPIVWAPNFAVGVNVLFALTKRVAQVLGPDYDIEIVEMHHRHKVDAPSGTALGLGEAAAKGRGVDLTKMAVRGRDGITGARERGTIGFASLRGGDVVGDHSVVFAADGERVELTHKASSRVVFARGAVRAAQWLKGKKPGLYDMADVLGFNE